MCILSTVKLSSYYTLSVLYWNSSLTFIKCYYNEYNEYNKFNKYNGKNRYGFAEIKC